MKHYGKLTAAAAAGFMALSAMGVVPVFAEGNDTVAITKTVDKNDSQALVPGVSFTYAIENGVADGSIYAGVNGGLVFTDGDDTLETNDDEIGKTTVTFTGASLNAPVAAYTQAGPGVYHYVVKETTALTEDYNGFTQAQDINVYVHVISDDNGTLSIGAITAAKTGDNKVNVEFESLYHTYTLAVTKQVTGNQGNKEKEFSFTGNVSDSGDYDRFTYEKNGANAVEAENPSNITTTLHHGDTFKIHGLSASDVAEITESDYKGEGYTTTIKKGETKVSNAEKTNDDAEDLAFTVENNKQVDTPTGIILTAAPYAAIVGLGGIFAGLFFRRKRED